jgi:hypothetical protein
MSNRKSFKVDMIDKHGHRQRHSQNRLELDAGAAVAREGLSSGPIDGSIGLVVQGKQACNSSNDGQGGGN